MRYFIDAEFNGFGGELISLAAVPEDEDAPPFYEAIRCERPVPWVRDNVMPVLHTVPRGRLEVARLFSAYLHADPRPVIVADWPEDIAHAASLLTDGNSRRLVAGAVSFQLLPVTHFSPMTLSQVPHNAYHDAVALRRWLLAREARQQVA